MLSDERKPDEGRWPPKHEEYRKYKYVYSEIKIQLQSELERL